MDQLTQNAVTKLYREATPDFHPWLQVIDIKKIKPSSGNGKDRYRVVLSDGTHYVSGMLATQMATLMENGKLEINSIIQLHDFIGNDVQGRRIIIVLAIENIKPYGERIGSPQNIEASGGGQQAAQPPMNMPRQTTYQQPSAPKPQAYSAPTAPPQAYPKPNPSMSNYQAAVSNRQTRGPVQPVDPGIRLSDIESLNPYPGGRWTIKARVTNRSPIKNWSNSRGEGKLFSFELLDAKGGEIRATMFNDAVDKFYELLRPGQVFYFSGGKVKMANKKFSSINNNYEITFDANADIRAAPEDSAISNVSYNFKKIAAIETLPADSNIDIIGIVKTVGECAELTSKAGKLLHKRDIILVDDSNAEIKITMWNERAMEDCRSWDQSVLAIKGCRVSDFNGRSIGTFSSTLFTHNPDIPEAGHLMYWYNNGGRQVNAKSLSSAGGFGGGGMGTFPERAYISHIKEKNLGYNPKPDYITIKGTVNFIKSDSNVWYQACTKCQKKVIQDVNQNYLCEKCQMTHDTCENRYILSVVIQDHSGTQWTTCFNEQGKAILQGKSADEMAELLMANKQAYDAVFKQATFKDYLFKLRVKAENVNEELKVKASMVNLEPLNYATESKNLLEAIAKYNY